MERKVTAALFMRLVDDEAIWHDDKREPTFTDNDTGKFNSVTNILSNADRTMHLPYKVRLVNFQRKISENLSPL